MYEFFGALAGAYREVAHVTEWTGLSAGAIIALGVAAYLDPTLRKIAIRTAIAIGIGYLLILYAYHVGIKDKQAEWNAANARAAIERQQRDANAAITSAADAANREAGLSATQKSDQEQIDALRKADANCHPITNDQLR